MKLNKKYFLVLILLLFGISINAQDWPIPSTGAHFDRIIANFAELHGGNRFHGAIDIDNHDTSQVVYPVQSGRVWINDGYANGTRDDDDWVGIEHKINTTDVAYNRRTVYMHIQPNNPALTLTDSVATDSLIARIRNKTGPLRGDHLHFEMWEKIDGEWQTLNPLNNDIWSLTHPTDTIDPEINQVFLRALTQNNSVPSGFDVIASPNNAIIDTYNNNDAARVHFKNRPGTTSNNITTYSSEEDTLLVYGNVGPIVHCRDVDINYGTGNGQGEGLTVHKLTYSLDEVLKYEILFDKFDLIGELPRSDGANTDILHTAYNTFTGTNITYGNNDYIRMYNDGSQSYLPPP